MTVGELRQEIEGLPDNTPVLVDSIDHSYRLLDLVFGTARYIKARNYYFEDFGDENAEPDELAIDALIGY